MASTTRNRAGLWASLVAIIVLAAVGGGAWWWFQREAARDAGAQAAVTAYVEGWSAKDMSAVPFADDRVAADFTATFAGLGAASAKATASDVERSDVRGDSRVQVTWTLPGGDQWAYAVPLTVVERGESWVVAAPPVGSRWNPNMAPGTTVKLTSVPAVRGDLLDRGGAALMPLASVYPVQLDPTRATPETAAALESLVEAAPGSLVAKLAAATASNSRAMIPVITYRQSDFDARKPALDELVGVIYPRQEQPLAVSRSFGQPLLGTFGAVTAEIVEKSGGRLVAGDRAGLSGLQGQYDKVLAVANSPADGMNRALTGRYAPGSAFKIASTHAFLTKKLVTPETPESCPATITVNGKSFRNFEGGEADTATFARNFAISCNTAFIALAAGLGPADLSTSAKALGIGAEWAPRIGVEGTFVGSVPETQPGTDLAASSIGQGRIEVSPLSVAVMAGSVARGAFLPPTLVKSGDGDRAGSPAALDPAVAETLRALMGKVVTEGSGGALLGAPGGTVAGKTGTAEYGTESPPKTRAWFAGFQGDLAFAVLVEDGKSGGTVAAPIARAFLDAYRATP